jgi:hypothetical protein
MKALQDLYAAHDGKVSDRWSSYLDTYQRLFAPLRDRPLRMLEIGVQNGGSLELWSRFFANAQKLVGCDINPDCARLHYDDPRVELVVGDANMDEVHDRIRSLVPELDLVIDDGSHLSGDIVRSFGRYFPMLGDDGLYVAEDLHCSYWKHFEGGLFDQTSSISFFKALADIVNHEHWGRPYGRNRLLEPFRARFGLALEEEHLQHIHSVEFLNSVCVVRKCAPARNLLGGRVVTDGVELVASGHHALRGSTTERFDQQGNVLASLENFPAEAIPVLREGGEKLRAELQGAKAELQGAKAELQGAKVELQGAKAELQGAKAELQGAKAEVQHLRAVVTAILGSRSWRYTAWLRRLRAARKEQHG